MTIRPQTPPSIALPASPNRRSVADLISLWESRAGVSSAKAKPVVEAGTSKVEFGSKNPEAREHSSFVKPNSTRPLPTLAPAKNDVPVANVPAVGLSKPASNEGLFFSVAPSATSSAAADVNTAEVVAPKVVPAAVNPSPLTPTAPLSPVSTTETSKPLQGGAGLVDAVTGQDGLKGALDSAGKGQTATALSNVVRSAVTMPIKTASAMLDAPRKIGDVASAKGRELVSKGDEQGGLTGAVKVLGGALAQALGGITRLAQPLIGMALMAGAGPVGWMIGAFLLGMFILKEAGCIVNNKVDEMETFKALRDVASGAGAVAGLVLEPLARPLANFAKGPKA